MPIISSRKKVEEIFDQFSDKKVSMGIFCTASHWNTEAILLAASRFAKRKGIVKLPLAVAMTFNYKYMPQATRVTYSNNAKTGFISVMEHLKILCCSEDSPYSNVIVLPHLDHADPVNDRWALTDGLPYLTSVMFDAQKYPFKDNINMTQEYMKNYGKQVFVEGIMDELSVEGNYSGNRRDDYIVKAVNYVSKTGVDFLVANLGTEQQSSGIGKCIYLRDRAKELTKNLGRPMLVLHGTSCLTNSQMCSLPYDGIIRVNMWTRIAREAGQYAAYKLKERSDEIAKGNFEATESRQYLMDSIEKAAEIMEDTLDILGYDRLMEANFLNL